LQDERQFAAVRVGQAEHAAACFVFAEQAEHMIDAFRIAVADQFVDQVIDELQIGDAGGAAVAEGDFDLGLGWNRTDGSIPEADLRRLTHATGAF
jgi:hypothetical protein